MPRMHYHAGSNMAGYMPDGDVETFTSRRAAASYSYSEAREYLASCRDGAGKDDEKWTLYGRDGNYTVDQPENGHRLPTYFWVSPCRDACELDG